MEKVVRLVKTVTSVYLWAKHRERLLSTQRGVLILMYHEIASLRSSVFEQLPVFCTAPESFSQQIDWLRKHFEVINIDEAVRRLRGQCCEDGAAVVLTSDDGWSGFYRHAVPLLRSRALPATIYITTSILDGKLPWYVRWRILLTEQPQIREWLSDALCTHGTIKEANDILSTLKQLDLAKIESLWKEATEKRGFVPNHMPSGWFMRVEEVREAVSAGITIGAHTVNHPQLSWETLSVASKEVLESKQILEQLTGQPVRHFAYPSGDYSDDVAELVRQAGFETAVTTDMGWNQLGADLFRLRRIDVHETAYLDHRGRFSEAMFALTITGEWNRVRRRLRFWR